MKREIHVEDSIRFDASKYLDSDEAILLYLNGILEEKHAGLLAAALGDVARAKGMTAIAKAAGMTREALYKALRKDSAPRFETMSRVCEALGVRLVVEVVPAKDKTAGVKRVRKGSDKPAVRAAAVSTRKRAA